MKEINSLLSGKESGLYSNHPMHWNRASGKISSLQNRLNGHLPGMHQEDFQEERGVTFPMRWPHGDRHLWQAVSREQSGKERVPALHRGNGHGPFFMRFCSFLLIRTTGSLPPRISSFLRSATTIAVIFSESARLMFRVASALLWYSLSVRVRSVSVIVPACSTTSTRLVMINFFA